jgi:sigma-B regulation protein RsbU (phosphoserine phosphatase)
MFITIVSGFINIDEGTIKFTNAGHQPPLFYRGNDDYEEIPADAPPLGILPGTVFPVTTIPLYEGSLYIFTDGVTESPGVDDKPLDVAGLVTLIEANSRLKASERLHDIVAEIRKADISQRDDITIMLIECRPHE